MVDDNVFLLKALDDAVDELGLAAFKVIVDDLSLRVAHALDDILLGRLCGDAAEISGVELREQLVADLRLGIEALARLVERDLHGRVLNRLDDGFGLEELDLADLGIELRLDLTLVAEGFLRRRYHRILEGADKDRLVDALFLADLLDDPI
jgi:hypothetical protein